MSIILLETIHPDARAMLHTYSDVVLLDAPSDLHVVEQTPHIEAIITRGRGQIRRSLIEALPDLRVIARCGVGLDNLDLQAARERGIKVVYAPGSTTIAVAEQTMLLILATARKLLPVASAVRQGDWAIRNHYLGMELTGKTLGIIGMGEIGQRVALLAEAFGMKVVCWNRSPVAERWPRLSLDALLSVADVVSLHVALTPETQQMIGEAQLKQMKAGALLINTARGAIVDQAAIQRALASSHLGGYGADVMQNEPPAADDPLLGQTNAVIMPHVAVLTDETYRKMCVYTVTNVLAVLRGEAVDTRSIKV